MNPFLVFLPSLWWLLLSLLCQLILFSLTFKCVLSFSSSPWNARLPAKASSSFLLHQPEDMALLPWDGGGSPRHLDFILASRMEGQGKTCPSSKEISWKLHFCFHWAEGSHLTTSGYRGGLCNCDPLQLLISLGGFQVFQDLASAYLYHLTSLACFKNTTDSTNRSPTQCTNFKTTDSKMYWFKNWESNVPRTRFTKRNKLSSLTSSNNTQLLLLFF